MRVKARTLRRAGLCLVLGVATSWLVAWGLVIAAWRGAWSLPDCHGIDAGAVTGPYLVQWGSNKSAACSVEVWSAVRITGPGDAVDKRWATVFRDNGEAGVLAECRRVAAHFGRPWHELGADAFDQSPAAADLGDARRAVALVHTIGWPRPMAAQVSLERWTGASNDILPDPPAITTEPMAFALPVVDGVDPVTGFWTSLRTPIRLPFRADLPGLAINTAFYSGVFAIPLLVVPAARRTLRMRSGRCPACNYDLSATPEGPCPECGAVQTVTAG